MRVLSKKAKKELEKALKFYEDFHWGVLPDKVYVVDFEMPKNNVVVVLGLLKGVIYETKKGNDKKPVEYIHAFEPPYPLLCCDVNKKQLYIIGGSYRIEKRGIVH